MVVNMILGGFLLRKKQAIRSSAVAPAASLASLSPVAAFGAPTILATTIGSGKPCAFSRTRKKERQTLFEKEGQTLLYKINGEHYEWKNSNRKSIQSFWRK